MTQSRQKLIQREELGSLDVIFYVEDHPPPVTAKTSQALKRANLGPSFDDLNVVIRLLHEQTTRVTVGAYGGARLLAAVALGIGLAERRLIKGQTADALRGDRTNWVGPRPVISSLVSEVTLLPATILAAQAAPAKTWICNDPAEESTGWASSENLVPHRSCLDFVSSSHGIAIVAGVLLECVVGDPQKPDRSTDVAQDRAAELLSVLGPMLAGPPVLHTLAKLAYASREECENVIGPDMPGLALKQAVERILGRAGKSIDADRIAAWLIPDVCDELRRDRSAFDSCFGSLQASGDKDRPDIPPEHFKAVAEAAASTTLAKRCPGATPKMYEAVLRKNFALRVGHPTALNRTGCFGLSRAFASSVVRPWRSPP